MTSTAKEYVPLSTKPDGEDVPKKGEIEETTFQGKDTPPPIEVEEKPNEEHELARAGRLGRLGMIRDAVNGEDDLPPECLFEATKAGHIKAVTLILNSKKLSANIKDDEGNTLLHLAAVSDNMKLLDYLSNKFDEELEENQKNELGQTPLISAVKHEKVNSTKFFLSKSADIEAVDQEGFSAFAHACASGNELLCNLLLRGGSDPTARYWIELYNGQLQELMGDVKERPDEEEQGTHLGFSPLFIAAWNGNYDAMLILLKQLDQQSVESQIFQKQAQDLNAVEALMLAGKDNMLAHLLCTLPNDLLQEQLSSSYFKGISLAHCLLNLKCYHTLKLVFDKQVTQKPGDKKVQLRPGILELQDIPGNHWTMSAPTLLNRITTEKPAELINHPLIKAYADAKFPIYSFYSWASVLYYMVFIFFLTFTIIHHAYAPNNNDFDIAANRFRIFCQLIMILMVIGYILVAVLENLIASYTTYNDLQKKDTWLKMNKGFRLCCPGICFSLGKAIRACTIKTKNVIKSLFVYYYDIRNVIDVLGSISAILLIPFWALDTQAQYLLASIVLLLNYLRIFKATRHFSCSGGYAKGVLNLFTGQYLKFILLLFVIIIGFYAAIFPGLRYDVSTESFYDFFETNGQGTMFAVLDQTLFGASILTGTSARFIIVLVIAALSFFVWLLLVAVLNAQFVHAYNEAFALPHQYKLEEMTYIERRSLVSILSIIRKRIVPHLEVFGIPFYFWEKYNREECGEHGGDKHDSLSSQIEDALNAGIHEMDKRMEAMRSMLEIITENQHKTNARVEAVYEEVKEVKQSVARVGGLDLEIDMDRVVVEVKKVTTGHLKIERQVDDLVTKVGILEADLANKLNEVQSEQKKHKLELNDQIRKLNTTVGERDIKGTEIKIQTLIAQSQGNHNESEKQLHEISNGVKRVESGDKDKSQVTQRLITVESELSQKIGKLEKAVNLILDKLNKD